MAKAALRTMGKKMIKCPYCNNPEPKEIVESKKAFNVLKLINPFNWIFIWRCWDAGYAAYCPSCNKTFPADGWFK